jgi:hypothetical protein
MGILVPMALEIVTKHRFQIGRHWKQSHGVLSLGLTDLPCQIICGLVDTNCLSAEVQIGHRERHQLARSGSHDGSQGEHRLVWLLSSADDPADLFTREVWALWSVLFPQRQIRERDRNTSHARFFRIAQDCKDHLQNIG